MGPLEWVTRFIQGLRFRISKKWLPSRGMDCTGIHRGIGGWSLEVLGLAPGFKFRPFIVYTQG